MYLRPYTELRFYCYSQQGLPAANQCTLINVNAYKTRGSLVLHPCALPLWSPSSFFLLSWPQLLPFYGQRGSQHDRSAFHLAPRAIQSLVTLWKFPSMNPGRRSVIGPRCTVRCDSVLLSSLLWSQSLNCR